MRSARPETQGDDPVARERRIARYQALVEARGGWAGGGYVFGPPSPTRSLAWLQGEEIGLRVVKGGRVGAA